MVHAGRRGQATVEFLIILMALVLVLSFVVNVSSVKSRELAFAEQSFQAKRIAFSLAGLINSAGNASNGFAASMFIEKPFDFNVSFHTRTLQVEWLSNVVESPLSTKSVVLESVVPGRSVRVSKEGNNVVVRSE